MEQHRAPTGVADGDALELIPCGRFLRRAQLETEHAARFHVVDRSPRTADVAAHVSTCAACSQAERLFARIDGALGAPLWQPPRGFARTITAHALQEAAPDGRAAVARAGLWLHHLTVWGLVGTAVYLAVHAASVLGARP